MARGGAFEREVSKRLSLWWTGGARDDVFWRTHGSGGRATMRRGAKKSTRGQEADIGATDPIGLPLTQTIAIECKSGYARASLHDLLDQQTNTAAAAYADWIKQARAAAAAAGCPYWAIIHRRNKRNAMLIAPRRLFADLGSVPAVPPFADAGVLLRNGTKWERVRLVVTSLDAFLETVTPAAVLALR